VTPISDRNRSASGLTVTPEDQERIYQFYHAGEKVSGAAWLVAGVLSPSLDFRRRQQKLVQSSR
jgi:hypothetical protein